MLGPHLYELAAYLMTISSGWDCPEVKEGRAKQKDKGAK